MMGRFLALSVLVLLVGLSIVAAGTHYTPNSGDRFDYSETIVLGDGAGNYSGYTESTVINGSLWVIAVAANGTESASYYNANSYQNNQASQQARTSSGRFTFSAETFLYVNGTDNETGYVNPYVWFFIDNSLASGGSFYLLSSPMTVVATADNYALDTAAGATVKAIFAEGNGSYPRDDAYGAFTATYNWKAYFDPATGYIIGYLYTEQDIDTAGDGFTITDTLAVTHTSYPLTPGVASSSSSSSSGQGTDWTLVAIAVVVVVVIIIVIAVLAISRARRRTPIPKHSATGQVTFAPPPVGPPPPGIHLTPSGQPAVQQIIIKETVKVNCRYCGSLIDSTAEKCPFCGATRS